MSEQTPAERLRELARKQDNEAEHEATYGRHASAAAAKMLAEEVRAIAQQLEQQQQGVVSIPVEVVQEFVEARAVAGIRAFTNRLWLAIDALSTALTAAKDEPRA